MAGVSFDHVTKRFGAVTAVDELTLDIASGEFVVLVGPSGCGKTTALRMLAGLEAVTAGRIRIGERDVERLPPRQRDIAMVFQDYALYPQMTVLRNLAFGLETRKVPKPDVRRLVGQAAGRLGLDTLLDRKPRQLSGGQRQRVALGRALVRQPQVFLMDEPLSNLDAKLRVEMRAEIAALQQKLGVTTIYVTHDQVEAMTMGKRIAVMRSGVLQQWGEPYALYDRPANLFVAQFIGSPPMNLFEATLELDNGAPLLALRDEHVRLPARLLDDGTLAGRVGTRLAVGIRPEYLQDARATAPGYPVVRGSVTLVETLGPERHVHVHLSAAPVVTPDVLAAARAVDAVVAESISDRETATVVRAVARFEPDAQVEPGETRELAIVPDKLRFFDLATGSALGGSA
jgi:multiple sugar transport system ATP-binding protein